MSLSLSKTLSFVLLSLALIACGPHAHESSLSKHLAEGLSSGAVTTTPSSPGSSGTSIDPAVDPKPSPAPSTQPSGTPSVRPTKPTKPVTHPKPITPVKPEEPKKPSLGDRILESLGLMKWFTRPYEQAYGGYSHGKLKNPDQIAASGDGVLKLFQKRDRAYGTLDLLTIIKDAAKEIHRDLPATESVQIGDIARKTGGSVGGHASHQNGLDADIALFRRDHKMMDPFDSKSNATGFEEDFIDKKGNVTANFDIESNWRFTQLLVSTGRIDRIFIDGKIKKAFCEYASAKGMREDWKETLRKLRHWPNHRDHMHVRITCPKNSEDCKPGVAIPAGDGCEDVHAQGAEKIGAFMNMSGPLDHGSPLNKDHAVDIDDGC